MSEFYTQSYGERQQALEQAKAAFFASGGQVFVVADRTEPAPDASVTDDQEVVATIRQHRTLGVVAAARAAHLHTTTVLKIAKRNGIEFETNTLANQEKRRAELVPMIRRLGREYPSLNKIAKAAGLTRPMLKKIAEEEGIELPMGKQI